MTKVSFFKDVKDNSGTVVHLEKIIEGIKGGKWQTEVQNIRAAGENNNQELKDKLKKDLPSFTTSGVFAAGRAEHGLEEPTFLIILDFDHVDVERYKAIAMIDQHVLYGFRSPSGDGYKMICRIKSTGPVKLWTEFYYNAFANLCEHFMERYNAMPDKSGKNVNRICFVTHDADPVLKTDCIPMEASPETMIVKSVTNYSGTLQKDSWAKLELAQRFVDQRHQFAENNRNNYIYELSCTLNRMGVDQEETVEMIGHSYELEGFDIPNNEWVKSIASAYKHHKDEHGIKQVVVDRIVEKPELKKGDEENFYKTCCELLRSLPTTDMAKDVMLNYFRGKKLVDTTFNISKDRGTYIITKAYNDTKQGDHLSSLDEISTDVMDMILLARIPSIFPSFNDDMNGGWIPGNIVGVIGAEGSFKTFYAMAEAIHKCRMGIPVLYGNYEMSPFQFMKRLILMVLGINLDMDLAVAIDREERFKELVALCNKELNGNLYVHSSRGATPEDISNTVDSYRVNHGVKIGFGVIDGIWHLYQKYQDEIKSAMDNAKELKEMGKATKIPFMVLSHSKTGVEKHERNQHNFVLGGRKILSNLDSFVSMSLIIDTQETNWENNDIIYKKDMVYARHDNRRDGTKIISLVAELNKDTLVMHESKIHPRLVEPKKPAQHEEGSRRRI